PSTSLRKLDRDGAAIVAPVRARCHRGQNIICVSFFVFADTPKVLVFQADKQDDSKPNPPVGPTDH
ncbi:MAG TPA: hypothetical protein VK747_16465, partial [Blastocatellia bacterium]|nr:hypothetical protein [Blastocatellia bacterium]